MFSALLPTLKSKDFTVLAVIDPTINPSEETRAVTGIFDGAITVTESEDRQVLQSSISVLWMRSTS